MRNIMVKDLMLPMDQYTTISEDATLRDAFLALKGALQGVQKSDPRHPRDFAVLVLDVEGQVLGRLVVWDVLEGLEPTIVRPVDSLVMIEDYSAWSRPLQNLASKARDIKVKDLVRRLGKAEYICEEATLDRAIHQLVLYRALSLIVTRGPKSVGILRVVDAFAKVCEAVKGD